MEYMIGNKEWIFSGIGVAVVSWLFFRKLVHRKNQQSSGDHSINVQAKGDVNISTKSSIKDD